MSTRTPKKRVEPEKITDEEVWLRAWCATVTAFNADSDSATRYADRCLAKFKERFRQNERKGEK